MTKGKALLSLVLTSVMILALCSCGSANEGQNSSEDGEDGIVTLQMSDEAKEYEEENVVNDGVKKALSEENFDQTIQALDGRGEESLPDCTVDNKLDLEKCEGSKVYTLTNDDYETVILYIHGGAWLFEISQEHVSFCDALATKLNAKVYMPLYPLAPQADSEETYNMIETLYKDILKKEDKNVYIMGDSAGGNISLGLMHTIKEEGLEEPGKMILIAPCSDMTFTNKEMAELDETDPELSLYGCSKCAEIWAGKENLKNPKNSAVYADVTGYPDTMIFQGTNDILGPDNYILYQNMIDAGVNAKLVKGEGFWHVFPIYPIPEQEKAIELIEEFCAE